MTKVLIIGEFKDSRLKASAGELVAAARQLGSSIDAALLGQGSAGAANGFGAFGIGTVHVLDGADVPVYSSDGFAAALVDAARGYDYIVASHSFFGRDLAARLAAALGATYISDVTELEAGGDVIATKPLYAGKVNAKFKVSAAGPKVITIRPKVFAPVTAGESPAPPAVQQLTPPAAYKSRVTSVQQKEAGEIDVKDADIIITGGRGVGGPEGFKPLRDFAQAIGCALGASRVAVDAGWIEHSHQVGQTGKTVNPKLYIACGVSGQIQHLAGMQTSRVIVAINSTESAPIFKVADYGIVGDLFEVVPELQRQILALRG